MLPAKTRHAPGPGARPFHRSTAAPFRRSALPLCLLGLAAACSNGNGDTGSDVPERDTTTLAAFGEPCTADADCLEGACFEDACTRPCAYQVDCPTEGYACGRADGERVLCVTTRYGDGPGQLGSDCVATTCDEAGGYRCIRETEADPYAYCTHDCADDRDCPHRMVCRSGADGRFCRPRGYCEPCLLDDQCGWANDDCIEDDTGERFCSQVCDPERPSTCPTDSLCVETSAGRFQCKPSFGRCVGDGELCHPCRENADCTSDVCITDRYTGASFCGSPCTSSDECPIEYYCHGELLMCRPRKGSCLEPSGGGRTCESCADFTDCYNGYCLDTNGDRRGDACADDCDPADPEPCGPWGTCNELRDYTGAVVAHGCLPHEGMYCWQYVTCVEECPDGPTGCGRTFCR